MADIDEQTLEDQIVDQFVTDDDVTETLTQYARGYLSIRGLSERLEYLLTQANQRAHKVLFDEEEAKRDAGDMRYCMEREDEHG